ncbi:Transmembrane exosortase [Novipirellula galeiformis]|uniref:Transmembrane exosortase n=1 Tax=Novipirellula galeiformis TaxID=2528004 RepID=A0A5C6CCR5_9BACT|nr:Transmembrane exosortase [Novipirellula galeiformis]
MWTKSVQKYALLPPGSSRGSAAHCLPGDCFESQLRTFLFSTLGVSSVVGGGIVSKRKPRKTRPPIDKSRIEAASKRAGLAGSGSSDSAGKRARGKRSPSSVASSSSAARGNVFQAALQRATGRGGRRFSRHHASNASSVLLPAGDHLAKPVFWLWAAGIAFAFVFAFWPTWEWLELQWRNEPDYSHGYIVIPLSLMLLWMRWDQFPGVRRNVDWRGLSLIGLGVGMRIVGRLAYMDFMDGWSLVPLVAGIVWLLLGAPAMRWAAPAICFLLMLVPLPYRAESLLSWNLQGVATTLSTIMLRILGLPAIAEGHTIWVDDDQLMIAQACSGLRIFVGMFAMAFFWCATVRRSWIDRTIILVAALPMALWVNALRITATGYLYGWFPSPASRHLIHDWSGYLMIPLAAGLLWCVKVFWERVYRPVKIHDHTERLRSNVVPS